MKLSLKEKFGVVVKEATKLSPRGGHFFEWYYAYVDAIESKRIEEFVKELTLMVEKLEFKVDKLPKYSKATIELAIEKVSRNISVETHEEKRKAYLTYMKNLFIDCKEDEPALHEIELFLSTLDNLTLLEIQILKIVYKSNMINMENIHIDDVDSYLILTTCLNLKNKGLLVSGDLEIISYNESFGHMPVSDVKLSDFGNRFVRYCLDN